MHKSEYMEMLNVPHGKYSSLPRLSNQWGLKTLVVPDFKFTKDFLLFFTQIFSNILNHIELYCGLCKKGVRFHKSTQSYLSLNPPKQIHQQKYWQQIYDEKLNSAAGHRLSSDLWFYQQEEEGQHGPNMISTWSVMYCLCTLTTECWGQFNIWTVEVGWL